MVRWLSVPNYFMQVMTISPKNLKLNLESSGVVTFPSVILEVNQFYTVKILALSGEGQVPDVFPRGKIAGITNIHVTRPYLEKPDASFLRRTFGGSALTQIVRGPVYALVYLHAKVVSAGGHHRIRRTLLRMIFVGDGLGLTGGAIVCWALSGNSESILQGGIEIERLPDS